MQATVMPTVNLLKKLHKQALAIGGRSGDEASESRRQFNRRQKRHCCPILFFAPDWVQKNGQRVLPEGSQPTADLTTKNHAPHQKRLGTSLIPRLLRSDFSNRPGSENQYIEHCVAVHVVCVINANRYLSCCVLRL